MCIVVCVCCGVFGVLCVFLYVRCMACWMKGGVVGLCCVVVYLVCFVCVLGCVWCVVLMGVYDSRMGWSVLCVCGYIYRRYVYSRLSREGCRG